MSLYNPPNQYIDRQIEKTRNIWLNSIIYIHDFKTIKSSAPHRLGGQ